MAKRIKEVMVVALGICASLLAFSESFGQEKQTPIQTGTRTFISLNGAWDVHTNKGLSFTYPPPTDGWKKEIVPQTISSLIKYGEGDGWSPSVAEMKRAGHLNVDEINARTDLSAWYQRKFQLPPNPGDKVALLTFKFMTFKSLVWLNGTKVGECVTGMAPTSYDVTGQVKWGEENHLVVGLAGVQSMIDLENETYFAPYQTAFPGILDDVSLELVPSVHIDDIFINTSVKRNTIDVQMTIINARKDPATLKPSCIIERYSDHRQCLEIVGEPATLAAGEEKTLVLSKTWEDPVLWSPDTPFLYVAVGKLNSASNELIDQRSQRFGFREFEAKGRQFYLNGKAITLYRNGANACMYRNYQNVYGGEDLRQNPPAKREMGQPCNNYRVYGTNPLMPQMCDEMGTTLSQGFPGFLPSHYPVEKRAVWLPKLKEHIRKEMKPLRNNPSIVIWNMCNETYWGRVPDNPEMKAICKEIVDTVRAMDPTRLIDGDAEVGWDGLLDIISLHYPSCPPNTVGELSHEYPHSGLVFPNDLYWLKDKNNVSWRARFDWDKPLSMGEEWWLTGDLRQYSMFGGEDVYNWVKYTMQNRQGEDRQPGNTIVEAARQTFDAYRVQGVACMNPWTGNFKDTVPDIAVRPLDFHPNFYGGKTATRKVVIFYESALALPGSFLQCFLTSDGRKIWEKTIPVTVKLGTPTVLDIPISPPSVASAKKAELTVCLRYDFCAGLHEKARYSETVFIMPETSLADIDTAKITLLDPSGETAKALATLKLNLTPAKTVDNAALAEKKLLIVAGDADLETAKSSILDFARKGGSVIFLQRQTWPYLGPGFPEMDKLHVASHTWKRSHSHPVVAKMDDGQFSYWRPDNLVGKRNFQKPVDGDFRVLIDAGGTLGMEWTPLCETSCGNGCLVFSQLSLTDRLGIEPAADMVMAGLIRYGLEYKTVKRTALRLLVGDNMKLEEILKTCRIDFNKGLKGDGPVLLDASYALSPAERTQIKGYLENGGKVWVHGFTPENVGNMAELLPFKPVLEKTDPYFKTAVRMSDSALMDNLSSADFAWAILDLDSRGDNTGLKGAKSTAKLGDYTLALPMLDAGDPLLAPALWVDVPVAKGHLLFDTLAWENAFDTEGERVIRIVSALALNMDVNIAKPSDGASDYFSVDIAKFANMGYMDEVAEDGKGGWLDMGKGQDLRFFLINHTGMVGGNGVAEPVPPFPEENRFCGIPFKLTAPEKNGGKAMIALRSTSRAMKLPDKIQNIPVEQKADQLFFINAANWVPPEKGLVIAKYVMHYNDGTQTEFPLRNGIEINDWFTPRKPEKAKICWSGSTVEYPVGLFLTEWENPFPAKVIKSIDIVGALTGAQLGVIGIAGGRKMADGAGSVPLVK